MRVRAAGVRAVVGHEWFVACVGAVALAIAMIWTVPPYALWLLSATNVPFQAADPVHTIIGDSGDPTGQAWQIAWNGHAISGGLSDLWDTNAFYPEHYGLAFTDSLLGYAPAGLLGAGMWAAVLRYNILFVLAFALAFLGGYALIRQLGAGRVGAAVAGAAVAYAPWRYGHDGHLNILSTGGITLALAMLARGHGFSFRPRRRPAAVGGGKSQPAATAPKPRPPAASRPGWAFAGWLVAAWQVSLGFGVGLPFAYVLASTCVVTVAIWLGRGRPPVDVRLLLADLGGGLAFAAVTGYLAWIYQHVRELHPDIARSWGYVALFSPNWRGLLTAPGPSLMWGADHEPARSAMGNATNEKVLLCGLVLYALAAVGLAYSIWTVRQRFLLALGIVVGILLALGTNGPLYRFLYGYLPGFDGIRTPGRLILWPTLFLAILAAGLITRLGGWAAGLALPGHGRALARVVTVPLLLLVLVEGLPKLEHVELTPPPAALAEAPTPMMVLPSDEVVDLNIALWSTDGFPRMVNGASGFATAEHERIREVMQTFPSPASQELLRRLGVRSVVVVRDRVRDTPYQLVLSAPDTPGVTRRDIGDDTLFTLD